MECLAQRHSHDLGSIVFMEHLNLCVSDLLIAQTFYIEGLGLTRDPYERFTSTVWVNLGFQQFHLNLNEKSQKIRGCVGLVLPKEVDVFSRLASVAKKLADTHFAFSLEKIRGVQFVNVTGPYGNSFKVFESSEAAFDFANRGDKEAFLSSPAPEMRGGIGIAFIEELCGRGIVPELQNYYTSFFESPARQLEGVDTTTLQVRVGPTCLLYFTEVDDPVPEYEGQHVCVYINNFSGLFEKFKAADALLKFNRFSDKYHTFKQAAKRRQFRVGDVLREGESVFLLEHEVRSMTHPSYMRPLVNRFGGVGIYCAQ